MGSTPQATEAHFSMLVPMDNGEGDITIGILSHCKEKQPFRLTTSERIYDIRKLGASLLQSKKLQSEAINHKELQIFPI